MVKVALGVGRRRGRYVVAAALALVLGVAAGPASADPTKEECASADETAQGLRAAGKLREAQDELTFCVARSCPRAVRNDCAERLDELQRALPSVVLAVRSSRGDDLTAVRVLVDGAPLTASLGGSALAVNPGAHTFTFEAEGYAPLQQEILIREGDKERTVSVVLRAADATGSRPAPQALPPAATPPAGAPPLPATPPPVSPGGEARGLSTRRWVAILSTGVGLAGLGAAGFLGLAAKSEYDTAEQETGSPRHDDSVSAVHTGNVATVFAGAGALLAAGGVVLWLTAPGGSAQVTATGSQVSIRGTFW